MATESTKMIRAPLSPARDWSARAAPWPARQHGVGFVEVLIAAFILAVSLLGLARLEAANYSGNHSSQLRSQAMVLAYDMVDRMRANRVAAAAGSYNIAVGTAAPTGTGVVATDLQQWKANMAAALPQGDGAVTQGGASSTRFLVSVQWDDSRGQRDPLQFAIDTEL